MKGEFKMILTALAALGGVLLPLTHFIIGL